jgi:hypothetical protein
MLIALFCFHILNQQNHEVPFLLCLLIAGPRAISNAQNQQQNALTEYAGKYQMAFHGEIFYLQISVNNGDLTSKALWTGEQNLLKHLSGDSFIMQGKDWSVKFIRDKKGIATSVLIRGTDLWTKVE